MSVAAIPVRLYRSIYEPFVILRRNRMAFIGLLILLFFALMATVGPEVVPLDTTQRFEKRFQWPSLEHPLGTDHVGRDTLQQIVHGSRDVLLTAFLAAIFTTAIAILVGMLAGLQGGMMDALLMLMTNIILTVPSFPVMMIIAAVWKVKDPVSLGLLLSIWTWGGLARAIRSQILSLKEREFIEAARALGLSTFHIVFRELLPNVMPYVAINFFSLMRGAITASVGLMFLGLIPFKATNWGMMLNLAAWQAGAIYVPKALFYFGSPMACIILFQLGAFFFASGLDEVVNPRLRA